MQAELTAADGRVRRSEEHIEELNRQIVEYKQELTEARLSREALRAQLSQNSRKAEEELVPRGELLTALQDREKLAHELRLAMLANREEKFIHLCDLHKDDGYEGLCREEDDGDEAPLTKETSKTAYSQVITCLERMKQQPWVCAGCVTHTHGGFDKLLRYLSLYDESTPEVQYGEDVMTFLMALTSRLSQQGEVKVCI